MVEAIKRAHSLFPWLLRGADFDNDSSFMNDVVVPWCRAQRIEVTRSKRAVAAAGRAELANLKGQDKRTIARRRELTALLTA